MTYTVSAFYKFVELAGLEALCSSISGSCSCYNILGTILLAPEGINGTISGEQRDLSAFFSGLRSDGRFADLETKESPAGTYPFRHLKVKVKREIVTLGLPHVNPVQSVGTYVTAENWNALLQDPDVVVVDTRNAYEVRAGTFPGALDPKTRFFRDFPGFARKRLSPERQPKVAMFCTGGIRCEKASSYLLSQGFEHVYHLKGGILKYLETVPREQSLWEGECFVFDGRVALASGLAPGSHGLCRGCGDPVALGEGVRPESAGELTCATCILASRTRTA